MIPLTKAGRIARYMHQNRSTRLTPRQIRRINCKENRARAQGLKAALRVTEVSA